MRQQPGGVAGSRARLNADGTATPPRNAPEAVKRVIRAGNEIADFPYIWGGGHGSFIDNGYECSGSVSYALAGGGLLKSPMVSGAFARWGDPGPGRWITIEASAGHVYMYVAGLRYDTSGRSGPRGSRWQAAARSNAGFTAAHPPSIPPAKARAARPAPRGGHAPFTRQAVLARAPPARSAPCPPRRP